MDSSDKLEAFLWLKSNSILIVYDWFSLFTWHQMCQYFEQHDVLYTNDVFFHLQFPLLLEYQTFFSHHHHFHHQLLVDFEDIWLLLQFPAKQKPERNLYTLFRLTRMTSLRIFPNGFPMILIFFIFLFNAIFDGKLNDKLRKTKESKVWLILG
jgi:hypothetical protein